MKTKTKILFFFSGYFLIQSILINIYIFDTFGIETASLIAVTMFFIVSVLMALLSSFLLGQSLHGDISGKEKKEAENGKH